MDIVPEEKLCCTFWINAGYRIIENNVRGCFFLFLAHAGSYPNPFPNSAGHGKPLLNLT